MKTIKLYQVKPGQVVSLSMKDYRARKCVTIVSNNMVKTDMGYTGAVVYNNSVMNRYTSGKFGGIPVILLGKESVKKDLEQLSILDQV